MRAREPRRRSTTFGRFVEAFGVDPLAQAMNVTPATIYKWLAGAASPTGERRRRLMDVAKGALTLEDLEAHRTEMSP